MAEQYDIFISYPRGSDKNNPGKLEKDDEGWVVDFHGRLLSYLTEVSGTEPKIFLDIKNLELTGKYTEQLIEAAQNSRIFLVIWSSLYPNRDWCRNEFQAFAKSKGDNYSKRLIVIGKHPAIAPSGGDELEVFNKIKDQQRKDFYFEDSKKVIRQFSLQINKEAYIQKLEEVGQALCGALSTFKDTPGPIHLPQQEPTSQTTYDNKVRVMVARVLEDQDSTARKKHLEEMLGKLDLTILEPRGTLFGDTNTEQELEFPNLERCDLYIQIIHPKGFLADKENGNTSPENLQIERVAQLDDLEKMLWCKGRESIKDEDVHYLTFDPKGEKVKEGSWAEFLNEVEGNVKEFQRQLAKRKNEIFVDYAQDDEYGEKVVGELRNHISRSNFQVNMDSRREKALNHISVCKGAIVVYGSPAYREQVVEKLTFMSNKVPKGRVYNGPPKKTGMDKWTPILPAGYECIDGEEGRINSSKLQEFLSEL